VVREADLWVQWTHKSEERPERKRRAGGPQRVWAIAIPEGPRHNPREFPHLETKMAVSRTFSIIKPDATRRNLTGKVNAVIEEAGLRIVAQKRVRLSDAQAKKFYEVHKDRPFYGELVSQMTAEPVVVQVLEGENAVARYREVMGSTNPKDAAEGTIRKLFALSIGENSVHGSDSPENAAIEIAQFFNDGDITG
jgi:nucleoside-diphosphate kinase